MKKGYRSWYSVFLNILLMTAVVLMLSGCPSGGDDAADQEGGGGGNTAIITLLADGVTVPADGKSSVAIGATLQDSAGEVVAKGTTVTFVTTLGTFANGETTYEAKTLDDTGVVIASLKAGLVQGTAEVTVTSNGVSQAISIELTGEGGAVVPASLSMATTKTSVKSDDSDAATVRATILDASNAVIEGATIVFRADGGSISSGTAETDAAGRAEVTFKSGTFDKSNRTATVTAEIGELNAFIPIQIVGSELALSKDVTQIPDDGSAKSILTVTASDASGGKLYNVLITLTASGEGGVQFEQYDDYLLDATAAPTYTGRTDAGGTFKVYVKGTSAGSVTVRGEGLGDIKEIDYTVNPSAAVTFGISELKVDGAAEDYENPFPLYTDEELTIIVDAPNPDETEVSFATTLGLWEETGTQFYTAPIGAGNRAEATLISATGGMATIEAAYGVDTDTKDSLLVAVSPLVSEAAEITIQASEVVVARSTGGSTNYVTLVATVKTASDQVVRGVPIAFSIDDPVGGGEMVSPVIVYTDSEGKAESTFTSGSLSTDANGIPVTARVLKSGTPVTDSINIVIGGTAGSVAIGRGTEVELIGGCALYRLCMAVQVADSNGNPVSGAVVSLNAWPIQYLTGGWYDVEPDPDEEKYVVYYSGIFDNEDTNRNLDLDLGEDLNGDGKPTPNNSDGGTLPSTVTTNEFGWAPFELDYLKNKAAWIKVRLSASTLVYGNATTSYTEFILPTEKNEAEAGLLPDSPWAAWTSDTVDGQAYTYTMPTFWGEDDEYGANYGLFTDRAYQYDFIAPPDSGTVKEDIMISVVNNSRLVGLTVPLRIVVP